FRDQMGYLFQNFGLLENQSIKENLDLGFVGQKISKVERLERQVGALEKVNLGYLDLEQKIYTLSGGEAQRVALAKTILKNPPLILADEPTAALDPENSEEVMNLLVDLKDENRIIIIATHNPLVWNKADEIIDMRKLAHV
ncbi:ATP-binding cassette domain-containing protein, partial [Streptococcus pneumoniae]